ncbi:MAG: asparagine synthase (glutamine-hydrolyzing) [Bacteroidota bacterium]|nr:asparagine synthase (glutamine-hydrolyzing) [Bacteroidota bacterium]
MCGIAGFIDFKAKAGKPELVAMTDSLTHRGPDASGYFCDQTDQYSVGLGHRRLSIIDLSPAGNQPMQFLNGRYWIIFNGEIYNYAEIKDLLTGLGHRFETHSDTEVILHAYHEWGADALMHFIGMFVFVIYDRQKKTIFCCRDRAGVKPFFYYWKNDVFLFGSELKALMANPVFEKEIDINAVGSFMQYGYISAPHSIFKNTFKLLPAHFLSFDLNKRVIDPVKYWNVYDYYNREKTKISIEDAVSETEKILEKAFNYRMVADVPVGVFLSGGYDSSCLVALLQKNSSQKLKTFTIGFEDEKLNEAQYAREIATILGTDHREYYCSEKDALDVVQDLSFYYDEPFADSSAIPTILVSRMAREHVTVALSADAGDEIFGGYDRYEWMLKYYHKMNSIPAVGRKSAAALLNAVPVEMWPVKRNDYIFQKKYEKLVTILRDPSPQNIFMGMSVYYNDRERKSLFKEKPESIFTAHVSQELTTAHFDPLTFAMVKDYETYLVDDILQKVDRATMSVSLEGREPFLDQHVIEWAAGLPAEYKIYKGKRKYILRQIVHQYLPEKLMDRPKMGFAVPVKDWLNNALKPLVDTYLDAAFIRKQDIFNEAYISHIKKSYYRGKKENDYKIWFLLVFQMWYDKWMNAG